eukprot:symbB.v1.2.024679.t1/scaffold2350.1/size109873/9
MGSSHLPCKVTEDFYETTRCYEDASGVIKLPQPEGDFVKWDDLASARRLHMDGTFFMVHDEARWVILEYGTGKLLVSTLVRSVDYGLQALKSLVSAGNLSKARRFDI